MHVSVTQYIKDRKCNYFKLHIVNYWNQIKSFCFQIIFLSFMCMYICIHISSIITYSAFVRVLA